MKSKLYMYPIIEEYQQGSSSATEVCAKYSISANQLYYWQGKYNKEHRHTPDFIEIKTPSRKLDSLDGIQITYPNGISIKIDKNAPLELLRKLIKLA